MLRLRLQEVLLLTAGLAYVTGAPVTNEGLIVVPGVQNVSLAQRPSDNKPLPTQQIKPTADGVATGPPGAKGKPSETFIKTVLKGFFEDLRNRPRLVDDILRHETYKELSSDPLAIVETVQLVQDSNAMSQQGPPQMKDQSQTQPLAAPVLTLVPVLVNPGENVKQQKLPDILIPAQQRPLAPGAGPSTNHLGQQQENNDAGLYTYQSQQKQIPSQQRSAQQQQQQKQQQQQQQQQASDGPKARPVVQPLGPLILQEYNIPQSPQGQKQDEKLSSAGGQLSDPLRQQDTPSYVFSIVPVEEDFEAQTGSLDSKIDGSTGDASVDNLGGGDDDGIIYDESPAYYYYVYYDDEDAKEADKKAPPLPESSSPGMSTLGGATNVQTQQMPRLIKTEQDQAIVTLPAIRNNHPLISHGNAEGKLSNTNTGDKHKAVVDGGNMAQRTVKAEDNSLVENELKHLHH